MSSAHHPNRHPYALLRKLVNARAASCRRLFVGAGVALVAFGPVVGVLGPASSAEGLTAYQARTAATRVLTQGFDVYNKTDQTWVYKDESSQDGGALDGAPRLGSPIPPQGKLHFEQIYKFLAYTTIQLIFDDRDDPNEHTEVVISTAVDGNNTFIPIYIGFTSPFSVGLANGNFFIFGDSTSTNKSTGSNKSTSTNKSTGTNKTTGPNKSTG